MQIDPTSFYGDWDVYSGPIQVELVLHEDFTYGQAVWGGAQTHWGVWGIEEQSGSIFLTLRPQGANPPELMSVYGSAEQVEMHPVLNVLPNSIQFYDGLMVRRYVPTALPPQPLGFPASVAAGQSSALNAPVPNGFFKTPIAPPSPAFSAPAPKPAPQGQSAPIMGQWKNVTADQMKTINDTFLKMQQEDQKTFNDIMAADKAQTKSEFDSREANILAGEKASHDFAKEFSDKLNPPRR
ncbi:MAG: hypothetical protein ABR907_01705 [Terracidiphilus sp.]